MNYFNRPEVKQIKKWQIPFIKLFGRNISCEDDGVEVIMYYLFGNYYVLKIKNPEKKDVNLQLDI